jgi:hypothetical protein
MRGSRAYNLYLCLNFERMRPKPLETRVSSYLLLAWQRSGDLIVGPEASDKALRPCRAIHTDSLHLRHVSGPIRLIFFRRRLHSGSDSIFDQMMYEAPR